MPAYNFKPQFADLVASGKKRQTIRKPRKRPTKPGETLYLNTGMRTAKCKRLLTAQCLSVRPVLITMNSIRIGNYRDMTGNQQIDILTGKDLKEFAQADGFADADAFFAFFRNLYRNENDWPLTLELIKW